MRRIIRWLRGVPSRSRQFTHDHPVVLAIAAIGVSTIIAIGLIARQADEQVEKDRRQDARIAAEFRHDTALNDYAGCRSGNRLRQANLDLVDGVLAILGPEGRETFLPIWRDAQDDFAPRDCQPTRERAVRSGVTEAELREVEQAPPTPAVEDLPLATCDGVGPFVRGEDDAYIAELDRDEDGIACEQPSPSSTTAPPREPAGPSSCAEVDGPIREGEPGYSPALDGDGDGVACE